MKTLFKEIFEYHHHFNQVLCDEFEKHRDKIPVEKYKLFCHVVNAHQIWNCRILFKTPGTGVHDVHAPEKCRAMDVENLTVTRGILDQQDLAAMITYTNSQGQKFSNKVSDILFHVANHATHHKGQIISAFRLAGIIPPVTDYIFYKR